MTDRVVMLSLHTSPLAQAGTGDAGGLNVYVNALSHALAARGVTVDIITTDLDGHDYDATGAGGQPAGDRVRTLHPGLRVHVLGVCPRCREEKSRLVECLHDLAERAVASIRAAGAEPVDVVHSHYWISGLAGITVAKQLGAALVHTMHTIGEVKQERDPGAEEDPRRHAAEQLIVGQAASLTANTLSEAADIQRIFNVPPSEVMLVQPGTELGTFYPPAEHDPRRELPTGRRLQLTFAGRLQPHKGPQIAVAAVGRLRQLLPDQQIQLTVAGRQSGPDSVDILALAAQEGVADVVVLEKPLPHTELAELFRRSDAVLVPSYSESFGLVALEAKACGAPVLAHNVGGLAELVDHRSTGLLIDSLDPVQWAQSLAQLVRDWDSWRRYSTAAAQLARRYSWDCTAAQALTAYSGTATHPYTSDSAASVPHL